MNQCLWKDVECKTPLGCFACKHYLAPEDKPNGRAEPVALEWEPFVDYCSGDVTGETPVCPSCGEMPYDTEQCEFCGQRFIQDEKVEEWNKPPEPFEFRCFKCGGTMVGTRAKVNGHLRAVCKDCGTGIIE